MHCDFSCFKAVALVLSLVVILGCNSTTRLQDKQSGTKVEEEIKAVYERLLAASKGKDRNALGEILTDNYRQVTNDGRIRNKDTRIDETLSQDDKVEMLVLNSFQPYVYENAAIAICQVRNRGVFKGEDYDLTFLATATFVKESNVWKIAATHLTLVKQ